MNTTKIIREINKIEFTDILREYKDNITVNLHALDHLSEAQRKVYKESKLINILIREKPRGVGLQRNGRYSAFFRRKKSFIRIIFEIKHPKLEIITFTNPDYMPNLKRIKK